MKYERVLAHVWHVRRGKQTFSMGRKNLQGLKMQGQKVRRVPEGFPEVREKQELISRLLKCAFGGPKNKVAQCSASASFSATSDND